MSVQISLLLVAVAELAAKGIHKITKDLVLANKAEEKDVLKSHIGAGRAVLKGRGTRDLVKTGLEVHVLPHAPDVVDHGVVKEEHRVVRAGVKVLELGWATGEPMATTVDAELVVAEETLHQVLEAVDLCLAENEIGHVGVCYFTLALIENEDVCH